MSVSIGNQLYDTVERDNKIYYILSHNVKDIDDKTPIATLNRRSDYIFEVVKSPSGFTSEQILIQSNRRTLNTLNYTFAKGNVE